MPQAVRSHGALRRPPLVVSGGGRRRRDGAVVQSSHVQPRYVPAARSSFQSILLVIDAMQQRESSFCGNAASALRIISSKSRRVSCRGRAASRSLSIRCEQQSAKQQGGGGGPDVWLGRAAMVGFASAIAVEVGTGKGFLQVRVT